MDHEPYELHVNEEGTRFQFQSIGKRGIFEKIISLTPLSANIYNLALLDYNLNTQEHSDILITDNGDMPKVLVTVMAVVKNYLNIHADKKIYFEGSTPARTRLYQISIGKVYESLKFDFNIYGLENGSWYNFEPNINFEGFLIEKKL